MNDKMQVPSNAPVLVAVNGSDGSLAAVRYAAHEAARMDCDLRIIHVAPTYLPLAGMAPGGGAVAVTEFEAVGHDILKNSVKPAYSILPRDRVQTVLKLGYRTTAVLDAAKEARLLVVGDDRTPVLARLAVGRFIGAVAARTPVPLVSVPSDWTGDGTDGRVVLAIKDSQRIPVELLRAGFEAASDRGAELEIVHVWDVPAGYGALLTSMMDDPNTQTLTDRSVRRLVAQIREQFPHVSYTTESLYGRPAAILHEHARGADCLLLARREHGFPLGHFGATGRALLRECPCPVEVLPIAERASAPTIATHRSESRRPETASARR